MQSIIASASDSGVDDGGNTVDYAGQVGNKRVIITKVYYKTPRAMWRFYGYYGGLNVIGNMNTYGQFSDDSTFEVVPTWQNKMQVAGSEYRAAKWERGGGFGHGGIWIAGGCRKCRISFRFILLKNCGASIGALGRELLGLAVVNRETVRWCRKRRRGAQPATVALSYNW